MDSSGGLPLIDAVVSTLLHTNAKVPDMQLLLSEQHVQWSPSSGSGDLPMHLA